MAKGKGSRHVSFQGRGDFFFFLKSLLNLFQYCFCFMLCFLGPGGMWYPLLWKATS